MCWLKRNTWKAGIAFAGLLLLLVLMVWVPVSAAGAYQGVSGIATSVTATMQATPTVDTTMTAMSKEQLTLQVKQLQNQLQSQNNWLLNNSTALIAAVATVIVALFGIFQWAITVRQAQNKEMRDREDERQKEIAMQDKESKDRKAEQDKDLRAQAEERFKTAVATLGAEKESVQVGGAILLRSFLNQDDKEIYGRYCTQIFDLAVAYLRLPRTPHPSEDPDGILRSPKDPNTPLPLTTLSQALIVVFKEAFPLARSQNEGKLQSLSATGSKHDQDIAYFSQAQSFDAGRVQLDNAFLWNADLKEVWMPRASLREADLQWANLNVANLTDADLRQANLSGASLINVSLIRANLSHGYLKMVDFSRAYLSGADLSGADLSGANLSEVHQLEEVVSLKDTDLRGVKGLTKEQLEFCKAKGAIIDEESTTSSSQSPVSPPATEHVNNPQTAS